MNYKFYSFDENILNFFFYSVTLYTDERRMYVKKWLKFMYYDQERKNYDAILDDEEVKDNYYELIKAAVTLAQLGLLEYVTKDDRVVGYQANREFYRRTICFDEVYADFNKSEVIECSDFVQKQLQSWSRQR